MLRKQFNALILACLGAVLLVQAQDAANVTTIGGHKAHATRILARMNAKTADEANLVRGAAKLVLEQAGLEIETEFTLVPGLLLVDEPKSKLGTAAFVTPESRARLLTQRIQFLKDSGQFAYAEPDYQVKALATPNDLRFQDGTLWGLQNTGQEGGVAGVDINAAKAWDVTTGTNTVLIAVIDTGVRYTHRDLAANIWNNPGEIPGNGIDDDNNGYVDDVHGINAITGSGDPFDDQGHGTHVSGTIGAAANNGEPLVGVAWKVSIMGLKFLSAEGSGFTADAVRCLQYAVKMKAKVSNNSWGGGLPEQSLADALAAARTAGHLFVAAAGNESNNNDIDPSFPASYGVDNIISVAAIDRKGLLADFSNFGRRSVHIGAPGVDIFSSFQGSDTDYAVESGTSMASPHVAGVAALVLASHPKASLFELRERILNSAVPLRSLSGNTVTGGRVDAFNAVNGNVSGNLQLVVDPPSGTRVLTGTIVPVFARVTDVIGVTNATVTATLDGAGYAATSLKFLNDGKGVDLEASDAVYSASILPTKAGTLTLTFIATATGKTGLTNVITYVVGDRPANDQFARPIKIDAAGGTVLDDNSLATLEAGEPAHANASYVRSSLWYSWTPTTSGNVRVDTYGSSATTAIAVYSGSSFLVLKSIVSAVPAANRIGTALTFNAIAGTTYRIAVAGLGDFGTGAITLHVAPGAAIDSTAPNAFITSPTSGFVTGQSQVLVSGSALDPDRGASGVREVKLSVNGSSVKVNGLESWTATVNLNPGDNILSVSASDYAENVSLSSRITINRRAFAPDNDRFAGAIPLTLTTNLINATNTAASRESGEPAHGGSVGGKSLWWSFTAPSDGILSLTTTNSTFDTLLGLYAGSSVDTLTTIASNDDAAIGSGFSALSAGVSAGQTVYIAVDGFSGASGTIALGYTFAPATLYTLNVTSGIGGKVEAVAKSFASNAPVVLHAVPNLKYEFAGWSGDQSSETNTLVFNITKNTSIAASFRPITYTDDFETGDFSKIAWTTDRATGWSVQTATVADGKYAAKAGTIGNSASSSLSVASFAGGGIGSFDLKVSSEENWDFLEFYLNGNRLQRWSGEVAWTHFEFPIPSGNNTYEWRYVKDGANSGGSDTAWIDNVQLRVRPVVDASSAATVKFTGFQDGKGQVSVTGQLGQSYQVQVSNDLVTWSTIATKVNTTGSFVVPDTDAARTIRYYRAIVAP